MGKGWVIMTSAIKKIEKKISKPRDPDLMQSTLPRLNISWCFYQQMPSLRLAEGRFSLIKSYSALAGFVCCDSCSSGSWGEGAGKSLRKGNTAHKSAWNQQQCRSVWQTLQSLQCPSLAVALPSASARLVARRVTCQKSPKHVQTFPAAWSFSGKISQLQTWRHRSLLTSLSIHINSMMQFRKKKTVSQELLGPFSTGKGRFFLRPRNRHKRHGSCWSNTPGLVLPVF